ncbi:MAG: hypothetical protein V4683_12670 [Bacteroidota bacterium]
MKKLYCTILALSCLSATYAQVGINATGAQPLSSAQLDVASTSKAFYPPRMTSGEKGAIMNPQAGALVYDTTIGALTFYNGSTWVSTSSSASGATYTVGQNAHGGKVFWVDETGQHGLVMSTADQSGGVVWFNGNTNTKAFRLGVYGGAYNTDQINKSFGYGAYAAIIAGQHVSGGFGDWYLPATEELNLMRTSGVSGIASGIYWSSNEVVVNTGFISESAYRYDFATGMASTIAKNTLNKVRAIRRF